MDWISDSDDLKDGFVNTLTAWYEHHKRDLPWRHTRNPYLIWLSEVILQQTRVAQGRPYYERFVAAYPTVQSMSDADERDLLRLWQGLGYYSRARNMHRTAQYVAGPLAGKFPETYQELLKLPGVGTYTAAAIASFSFNEKAAVVDGNVYRVLARVFGVEADITTTLAKKTFAKLADQLIQLSDNPATYNQAIMEFGAIQCTPVSPDCLICPLQQRCQAYLTGRQRELPVKSRKNAVRERYFNYIVIRQGDRIALKERTEKDIWQHLYDFCLIETEEPMEAFRELPEGAILNWVLQEGILKGLSDERTHVLSHQRIRARFWLVEIPEGRNVPLPDGLIFCKPSDTERLPKPILVVDYLKSLHF
ncbi:A/G-specific DNA-adenine glycosylase [Larkinella arboricola]|uniref:Adenine DNA glycosylase n=1 Tax=Larkinella arboricola TaxID=643671 RepID=A0A327X9I5_LARAB|nr:A/G-specific adenine glycosylase [Larkinella arboricola]RAK02918.1 A/G-specific DNA-adenine glycosylase [Larkinella arboricola]